MKSLLILALPLLGCGPQPPELVSAPPPALTTPEAGPPDPVADLLGRLEEASLDLRDFEARIDYEKWDAVLQRRERRLGTLLYQVTDRGRRLGILLEWLIVGQRRERHRKNFIFDGVWLIEKDHEAKLFLKRQIAPPGKVFDPLKLGEGPFPLPIGQPAREVLARFDVALLEQPSDERLAQRLQGMDLNGLLLVPKPGTRLADDFARLELFYDTATGMPVGINAVEPDGDRKTVFLSNLKRNQGIDPERLAVEEPDPREWQIDVRPWR